MAFSQGKIEPGQAVISLAQTGASLASTTSMTTGASVMGLSSVAWTGVGIALAVVGVVYSLVRGFLNKKKAKRKAKEALYRAYREIGKNLISQVYGMEVPGWSDNIYSGEYTVLGIKFYNWAKKKNKGKPCEEEERQLAQWLNEKGLEPTRFMGAGPIAEEYSLDLVRGYVAYPEKYLTGKESLEALGFSESEYSHLPPNWFVRLFEIISWIPKAFTELQAKLIKADLEYHLSSGGLDPVKMFGNILPHELLPEALKEVHVVEGVKSIKLTDEGLVGTAEFQVAGMSNLLILFFIGLLGSYLLME